MRLSRDQLILRAAHRCIWCGAEAIRLSSGCYLLECGPCDRGEGLKPKSATSSPDKGEGGTLPGSG